MGAAKLLYGWNTAAGEWLPMAVDATGRLVVDFAAVNLGDLGDVNLAGIAAGDLIYWNAGAGEWQVITPGALGGAINLDDLADVNAPAPAGGEVLTWDAVAGEWISSAPVLPPSDGWIAGPGTWSYSSADAPTFVISINADVTGIIGVGQRIKLTQTTVKYFIVTAVGAFGGGVTLVTVYGGTDYVLAIAAITSPYYSLIKAPFGFNTNPAKWTVTATDIIGGSQALPVANTWYNLAAFSMSVPLGDWIISYSVEAMVTKAVAGGISVYTTLSTANNSETDTTMTKLGFASSNTAIIHALSAQRYLLLAAKTTYYLNTKTDLAGMASLLNYNSLAPAIIRAVCAYL